MSSKRFSKQKLQTRLAGYAPDYSDDLADTFQESETEEFSLSQRLPQTQIKANPALLTRWLHHSQNLPTQTMRQAAFQAFARQMGNRQSAILARTLQRNISSGAADQDFEKAEASFATSAGANQVSSKPNPTAQSDSDIENYYYTSDSTKSSYKGANMKQAPSTDPNITQCGAEGPGFKKVDFKTSALNGIGEQIVKGYNAQHWQGYQEEFEKKDPAKKRGEKFTSTVGSAQKRLKLDMSNQFGNANTANTQSFQGQYQVHEIEEEGKSLNDKKTTTKTVFQGDYDGSKNKSSRDVNPDNAKEVRKVDSKTKMSVRNGRVYIREEMLGSIAAPGKLKTTTAYSGDKIIREKDKLTTTPRDMLKGDRTKATNQSNIRETIKGHYYEVSDAKQKYKSGKGQDADKRYLEANASADTEGWSGSKKTLTKEDNKLNPTGFSKKSAIEVAKGGGYNRNFSETPPGVRGAITPAKYQESKLYDFKLGEAKNLDGHKLEKQVSHNEVAGTTTIRDGLEETVIDSKTGQLLSSRSKLTGRHNLKTMRGSLSVGTGGIKGTGEANYRTGYLADNSVKKAYKHGELAASAKTTAGGELTGGGNFVAGREGLYGEGVLGAKAGLSGEASASAKGKYGGVEGTVKGLAGAEASGSAKAGYVRGHGGGLAVAGELFTGTKVEATGKVGLGYRDVRGVDHNFISVQGTASARAGAGIGGSWSLMYRDGKLVAGASLAATWGIGAGVGAEVVFNISELATALFSSSKFADSMYTAGSKFVDIVGAAMKAAGVDARTTALELFRALRANGFGLKAAYHYVMD